MDSYMERCIHLKACRRVQAIGKKRGHQFARHCDEDCTAYVDVEKIRKEWNEDMYWAIEEGKTGLNYVTYWAEEPLLDLLSGGKR